MKTNADIQSFLMNLGSPYEEVGEGMWVLHPAEGLENLVINLAGPVLVFRIKLMNIPERRKEELFRTLLELNASEMIHGAYGIESDAIVISDALELENLDYNEFTATIDDISLAVATHRERLTKFREVA